MRVRSHKLKLVMSPTSNSRAGSSKPTSALFRGADTFIPVDILEAVRTTLFAANRQYNFDAEDFADIVQSCLLKVWQKRARFDTEELGYFAQIVNYTVTDYFRKRSKQVVRFEGDIGDLTALEIDVEERALNYPYSKNQLLDLVLSLDEEEAAVVLLRIYEGFTYRQISVQLGRNVSTVKRRFSSAVSKLRSKFGYKEVFSLHEVETSGKQT